MNPSPEVKNSARLPIDEALRTVRRPKFMGLTFDDAVHYFFRGNATISIIVLLLIVLFLFKEGSSFMGMNQKYLESYRQAGLEFVDIVRLRVDDHRALDRFLGDIRSKQLALLNGEASSLQEYDQAVERFSNSINDFQDYLTEYTEIASNIKEKFKVNSDLEIAKQNFTKAGKQQEADQIEIVPIDFLTENKVYQDSLPRLQEISAKFEIELKTLLAHFPTLPDATLEKKLIKFKQLAVEHGLNVAEVPRQAAAWDWQKPIPWYESFTGFIFGRQWLTASFWQDWYGILPLFIGSALIAVTAVFLAVPFAVGAAIYVNQVASRKEQTIVKPYIEFMAAVPSVVWGFFGIAVVGQLIRAFSEQDYVSWIPFFPILERLNVATAACLLAVMAIPTIFSLAEDALQNVPKAYTEASLALGATKFQTIWIIMIPTALSGIISAIILGLGRVIGETMVVLLCSGGRIQIPDFTGGLAVFFTPVHTMTGIIAQEMGEVVRGSIHYRALFMVGIVLFFVSLVLNYYAHQVVKKYKISNG